ncbi:hypothetical protein ABH975_003720 [Bradyrhizobium ottawaense]
MATKRNDFRFALGSCHSRTPVLKKNARRSAPVGQNSRPIPLRRPSSPVPQNIPLYRNSDLSYRLITLARDEGRIAIVTNRGLGSDGRDGVGRDGHCRAASAVSNGFPRERHDADSVFAWLRGRAHATPRIPSEDVRGRRSRVVPTPGVCASSLAVMWRPTGARIDHPQGDGGNSATLPEESTKDTVKTIRAGKAGRPATPVVHPVCISVAHGSRVPAGARPSLRPCHFRGRHMEQTRAICAAGRRTYACCLKCPLT